MRAIVCDLKTVWNLLCYLGRRRLGARNLPRPLDCGQSPPGSNFLLPVIEAWRFRHLFADPFEHSHLRPPEEYRDRKKQASCLPVGCTCNTATYGADPTIVCPLVGLAVPRLGLISGCADVVVQPGPSVLGLAVGLNKKPQVPAKGA